MNLLVNRPNGVLLRGAAITARFSDGSKTTHFVGIDEKSCRVKITPAVSGLFVSLSTWVGTTGSNKTYILETSSAWIPPSELFEWLNANQVTEWEILTGKEEIGPDPEAFDASLEL